MIDPDPMIDGIVRVARLHSRDGLDELGHAYVLATMALMTALKIWLPALIGAAGLPVAGGWLLLSFGIRKWKDRIRLRIAPMRTGYAGGGTLTVKIFVSVIAVAMALSLAGALLVQNGLLTRDAIVPMVACGFGAMHLLKAWYTKVPRTGAMAILSVALAIAIAAGISPLAWQFLVWASILAALYGAVGAWVLWTYLQLPEHLQLPDQGA